MPSMAEWVVGGVVGGLLGNWLAGGPRETDEHEMGMRAEGMTKRSLEITTKRSLEITLLDVDTETDTQEVADVMQGYGEVKRCERVTLSGDLGHVLVDKVKVELVRNGDKLPNRIHYCGRQPWLLQYEGCDRYCFDCGYTFCECAAWGEEITFDFPSTYNEEESADMEEDPEFKAIKAMEEESEKLRLLQINVCGSNSAIETDSQSVSDVKVKKDILAKEALLLELKNCAERIIGSKAPEMSMLLKGSDEAEDLIVKKQKEIAEIDAMKAELDSRKVKLVQDCEQEKEMVGKLTKERRKLEHFITVKLEEARKDIDKLGQEIELLKAKENVQTKAVEAGARPSSLPNSWKLDFISKKIEAKVKDLECPVCFEVASSPIFKCSEDHLICSVCRPKVSECPECRVRYTGEPRRHRYAEKAAEELEELWRERAEVLAD